MQVRRGAPREARSSSGGFVPAVIKVDGTLQNTVIYTYPGASQFWTYKREEFLKHPVYSREFPPCRYCR